jgi:hypothetical protein
MDGYTAAGSDAALEIIERYVKDNADNIASSPPPGRPVSPLRMARQRHPRRGVPPVHWWLDQRM